MEDINMSRFNVAIAEIGVVLDKIIEFQKILKGMNVPLEKYAFLVIHIIPFLKEQQRVLENFNGAIDLMLELLQLV